LFFSKYENNSDKLNLIYLSIQTYVLNLKIQIRFILLGKIWPAIAQTYFLY